MTWYGKTDLPVTSFKQMFEVTLGKMLQTEPSGPTDSLTPYLNSAAVQDGYVEDSNLKFMWASDSDRRNLSVRANDLVVCEGGDVGRSALVKAHSPAIFQNSVHRVRPRRGNDIRFAKYTLDALRRSSYLDVLCNKATIRHFTADKLANLEVPHSDLGYQSAACDYLDRETAQIDELIRKQEQLIELLAEKRQAVITQGVTKGLDPTAPIKPSGQPYLGEIPSHWIVRPFRLAAEYQEGPGIMAEDFLEEGVPLLRIAGVKDSYASLLGCKYLDPVKVATRWSHFRLRLEDVLISASASMGTVSEVGPETAGSIAYTGIIRLRPRDGATKEFLKLLVVSDPFLRQIELHKTGSTMQHYGPSHLSQMRFAFPPTSEQRHIVDHVAEGCYKIDRLLEKAHTSIDLLKERRSALISDAVAGKLDVRKEAS